jgi:PqqD family protein of HPr-rel-A system
VTLASVQRWQPADHLIWTHYDDGDEWVVYDPASGDVHLLTGSARNLWILITDGQPHSIEDLVATVAAQLRQPPDEQLMAVTQETLSSMDRAGLVRPIAS